MQRDVTTLGDGAYEAPKLTGYGTIEEWTRGAPDQIDISIIILP